MQFSAKLLLNDRSLVQIQGLAPQSGKSWIRHWRRFYKINGQKNGSSFVPFILPTTSIILLFGFQSFFSFKNKLWAILSNFCAPFHSSPNCVPFRLFSALGFYILDLLVHILRFINVSGAECNKLTGTSEWTQADALSCVVCYDMRSWD